MWVYTHTHRKKKVNRNTSFRQNKPSSTNIVLVLSSLKSNVQFPHPTNCQKRKTHTHADVTQILVNLFLLKITSIIE